MIINQLSVFIENRKGRLAAIMNTLAKNDIDISALSLADTSEFGVLRLIVNQPEKGREVLMESGVTVRITRMVAAVMDDKAGGAAQVVQLLTDAGIDVEYMYACVGKTLGKALMVMRVNETDRAEALLHEKGFSVEKPEDIYRI